MPETYFIGGAPRVGKTIATKELVRRRPMFAASADAIRRVAKGLQTADDNPELYRGDRGHFGSEQHVRAMRDRPDVVLRQELGSAAQTWKSVLNFLSYYKIDGKDAAIEGVAVLPELLQQTSFDHRAVFLVNLDDPTDNMLDHAQTDPNDWVNLYDESTIRTYGRFNMLWNEYYAGEAAKYGYPVVEVDTTDFQTSIDRAASLLLANV